MRPYYKLTDDEVEKEIGELLGARKTLMMGGIAVIAGEGRRIEYAPAQRPALDGELRELYAEARRRNLEIGGTGGAIAVEIG